MRELSTLYRAYAQAEVAALPELPIQYTDFAAWQQTWLQGAALNSQLDYWREQLRELPVLDLPCDRPRPTTPSYAGATQTLHLSPQVTRTLAQLSQQQGVSLFMTLLAAFQTLLYRYTGQEDIAIGSPIANRHRSELEGLIGFFVNSLVMRTKLSGQASFLEVLAQVRQMTLDAYAHQDLPFERLVEELEPERQLSRNPLFQVAFALQNAPIQPLILPGLVLEPMPIKPGTTRFDLEVHLWEPDHGLSSLWQSQAGLNGFIIYNTDLYNSDTIERLVEHFQVLLEAIATRPETPIAYLPILTSKEQQQLLVDWNQTQALEPKPVCFHHQFAAWVRCCPETLAIVTERESLTYQELNDRANRLAQALCALGVRSNTLVGLCVDRSTDMLVGILGILKAGGAYVPLDPNYPSDRLYFMIRDAQIMMLLTQSWLVNKLPAQLNLLCLDQELPEKELPENLSVTLQEMAITLDDLAYVIYTSGSTGTPKGVLIQHRGLANVARSQHQAFHLPRASRILQFSSLSFDASVFEIVMALGSGSTLYVPSVSDRLSPTALANFLRVHQITHTILPPSMLAILPSDNLPALQTVISGGEACSPAIVDRWAQNRQFFNAYGPTETTIWATIAELRPGDAMTIGRPVANTQIYILDDHWQPVPVGMIGELYVGGEGVAGGYLNQDKLTKECFIEASTLEFNVSSPKLYKTGDRARYRSDGTIEFLGRSDQQVKIRGFRIELEEITALLKQYPTVQDAVAIAQLHGGDRIVSAYCVFKQPDEQTLKALETKQIEDWQTLYNQIYQQGSDITGWNSSYTRQPIPVKQMQEWLHYRVQQILALQPQRVLEIGCGTGLLLLQIAPHCQLYWGTDFSNVTLTTLEQQVAKQSLAQVKLLHRQANDFTAIEPSTFDVVILNSVVQYFPSLDYFIQVLAGAIPAVTPGGVIFLGDICHASLLKALHTAVQLDQTEDSLERVQLQQRVEQALFEEPELAIEPLLFSQLQERFAEIQRVQIRLLRGRAANEMTQFRYDVLLHIGTKPASPSQTHSVIWLDWTQHQLSIVSLRHYLDEQQPEVLGITNVPNQRVVFAVNAVNHLTNTSIKTVGRLRKLSGQNTSLAIDPQVFWDLETELPYRVDITWSFQAAHGNYDVVFIRRDAPRQVELPLLNSPNNLRSWESYSNYPLQAQFARQQIPHLRHYLKQKLPDYMQPAALVALEKLPLTPSGKIDRTALSPVTHRLPATLAEPRSPLEIHLIQIWSTLLRLERVSIHDNFFELGGHSLLATQMVSRIRQIVGVEVPLAKVFEAPTIAQLAVVIAALSQDQAPAQPALVKRDRAAYRRSRASFNQQS